MNYMNKKITTPILSLATVALIAFLAITPASAQTTVNVSASTRLPTIISKGNTDISARITALNALNTRVAAFKNVPASEKTNISTEVQTNISGLTALQAKLDADTDVTTAGTDAKSIFGSFRIYALVIPQGYITAASDRVETITGMLTTIGTKLQTRITADQSAGKDVTAMQASLADLNAKIADANTNAQSAQSSIAGLVPDQGNTTIFASNSASLKAARAQIKVSTSDLVTARADAQSIIKSL
jgi:hypothetical protein